jgi:hypothetical protein
MEGFAIMDTMNPSEETIILFIEPKRVADWDEAMLEAPRNGLQSFSGRTYAIRLLYVMFHSDKPLTNARAQVIKDTIRDYPEFTKEVKERFPQIF